ncbi:S8 family serine peptidase [Aerosakkonemataceae cyanobacterium BLCC-F154]|uniref:S8 family serine peptidase n=1 Tax=Floridaenema fluviatile BLCC-F154 TaxID=3153640 RepID=A0ABV4Y7B1_9CYAN
MLEINDLFNENDYLWQNTDVAQAVQSGLFASGAAHFYGLGIFENRNPSGFFDESYYLRQNPDVAQAVQSGLFARGLDHFLQLGQNENRSPNVFFNTDFYLSFHPDIDAAVATGTINASEHFIRAGQFENRDPISEFYTDLYLEDNPDVAQAVTASANTANPLTPIRHFINFGQYENRYFGPDFDPIFYLQENPDVAAAVTRPGLSPIKHFLEFGLAEGRLGFPPDSFNINLNTARELGILGSTNISDFVGNNNPLDLYRFSLDKVSQLDIALNGLSADADLLLIQDQNGNNLIDDNELLEFSTNIGTEAEAINTLLTAGTYFVGVEQYEGDTNYNLSISATPAEIPIDNAGNTLNTARDIGTLTNPQNYSDFVGVVDQDDFYRFTLDTRSDVNIVVDNLSADADLKLIQDLNNNGIIDDVIGLIDGGEIVASSENFDTDAEIINVAGLDPGTYFVRVYPYSGNTNYNLNLSTNAAPLTPLPDLSGASFNIAQGSLTAGSNLDVQFTVQNTQPVDAGEFTVGFYLSQSPSITPSDIFLGSSAINGLTGNTNTANLTASLKLPEADNSFWSGDKTYYIGMVVDSTAAVNETNENNNSSTGELRDFKAIPISSTATNEEEIKGGDFDPIDNQASNASFTNFRVSDASGDNTPNTIFQGGAIRLDYNVANADSLANVRLEILANNTVVSTVDLGAGASLSNQLVNLVSVGAGNYQLRTVARNNAGQEAISPDLTVNILPVSRVDGDFTGKTLDYAGTPATATVVLGRGGTDTLNLNVLPTNVTSINGLNLSAFNPLSGSTNNQAIFGGTAFDYLTLADGREIYFQGIEYLKFADNSQLELQVRPNDLSFSEQWNSFVTDVPSAWRFTQGSNKVLLVSLDSGITLSAIANGATDLSRLDYDETKVEDGAPEKAHGQQAISVMASTANNNFGVAGVNWNSNVYVNNLYEGGIDLKTAIERTMNYAKEKGYERVVFQGGIQAKYWLTGGGKYTEKQLQDLISSYGDTAFFAVAAGNGGPRGNDIGEIDTYLTSVSGVAAFETTLSNVMSVGALRPGGEANAWYYTAEGTEVVNGFKNASSVNLAIYSNRGSNLTLVAPTDSPAINSSGNGSFFGGTSCANPNMAGMASLVWSVNPQLTGGQLRQVLIDTAFDLGDPGRDTTFGYGLVNTDAAVRRAFALARDQEVANLYSGSLIV